ncbi:hypothetical protein EDD37DRAFT_623007 [Exophiala viscosa]|uniref:uncharacterized protein n=1 Tax=Exophiala viscosa TaxID=2486360 RepID=UPI00219B0046|nr:hypothetical protein EDD37DRAFT_623007 [Exophiala viscosa]
MPNAGVRHSFFFSFALLVPEMISSRQASRVEAAVLARCDSPKTMERLRIGCRIDDDGAKVEAVCHEARMTNRWPEGGRNKDSTGEGKMRRAMGG